MYYLKAESSFDSAHFLSGYEGKCKNIHGHRWRVEIEITATELQPTGQLQGMIVDFKDLKNDLKEEADHLDHKLIIQMGTLKEKTHEALLEENFAIVEVEFRPTAENFAKYFFDSMTRKGYNVKRATIYETPTNCATYGEN